LNLLHRHFLDLLDLLVTDDIRLVIGHFQSTGQQKNRQEIYQQVTKTNGLGQSRRLSPESEGEREKRRATVGEPTSTWSDKVLSQSLSSSSYGIAYH
jgi:hypothetical protein